MKKERILSALLIIGFCCATGLRAQSALQGNPRLDSLRAIVAYNQSRINALSNLYNYPVATTPNFIHRQRLGAAAPVSMD
jgi:hypothetical protein